MTHYEIVVRGHLASRWSEWLGGLAIAHLPSGDSLLKGQLPDQTALYSVLLKLRDLAVTLNSVRRVD